MAKQRLVRALLAMRDNNVHGLWCNLQRASRSSLSTAASYRDIINAKRTSFITWLAGAVILPYAERRFMILCCL
ncbi:hypothetical protein AB1N83_013919 [Pleurotus pulmonarius]